MLRQRVFTAVLLLAGLFAALFLLPLAVWLLLVGAIVAAGAWEWGGLARLGKRERGAFTLLIVALYLSPIIFKNWFLIVPSAYLASALFWALVAPLWLRGLDAPISKGVVLLMGAVVLLPAAFALTELRAMHAPTLLLFLGIVFVADIAAYFVGRRYGKRKLAPSVSPGKTWAGVYGAYAATLVYALLWIVVLPQAVPAFLLDLPGGKWLFLLCVVVLTTAAIVGDLFESAMKRQAGVKDSGNLLPGHGGVLDRVDALLPLLPLAALLVTL